MSLQTKDSKTRLDSRVLEHISPCILRQQLGEGKIAATVFSFNSVDLLKSPEISTVKVNPAGQYWHN